ncbi:MAG: 30S ribosomal protein S1 [Actinomycetota bacterium]
MPQSNEITTNDIGDNIDDLVAAIDATIKPFSDGDLVSGTIVKIDPEEVLVDIGYKSEGVIPARELSIRHEVDPSKIVSVGEQIEALVLQKEDKEGRLILSKKRATYERAWGKVEDLRRSGETVKGLVIEVVKGGLIVDIGLRGFLPASLVELRRVRDLQQFVGQELECKIIELDKNRNNVVLSRRAFLEDTQSEQRKGFLENLAVGEKRTGVVSSIVNFGAFVDLGGVDGLVHVSELSWRHVDHPSEVVQIGQEIAVEVLSVELERDRVSLSLKNTQEDPWEAFARTRGLGDVVEGSVTKLVPFGAFVKVAEGIEGLVHISELSEGHVELPEQVVALGQEVQARIIDIDLERRRISLSLKQASENATDGYSSGPDMEKEESDEVEFQADAAAPVPDEAEPAAEVAESAEDLVAEAPEASEPSEVAPEEIAPIAPEPPEIVEPIAPPQVEEQLAGELLEAAEAGSDESLEAILEDMRRETPKAQ